MEPLGPFLAGYGALFGEDELTAYEIATGATRAYQVGPVGGYIPGPVNSQGDYFDPNVPSLTADAEMSARLDAQLALLQEHGVYIGFGFDAFGAPSWMPGTVAPYWDRAAGLLGRIGPSTKNGWSYLIRLTPIGMSYNAAKSALSVVGDAAARGAEWAATKVGQKSREMETAYTEYSEKKGEFDRKIAKLAKTDPAKAEELRRETYGAMEGPKQAFLRASSQFMRGAGIVSEKALRVIRNLRSDGGAETVLIQGDFGFDEKFDEDVEFGDGGAISIPVGTIVSVVVILVVVVAAIYLIKTLLTDLTIGVQQADQSLFEQERQRGIDSGLTEEEAVDRALSTVEKIKEGRLDINAALPWIFGIAIVAVGVPTIYKVVKDIRE